MAQLVKSFKMSETSSVKRVINSASFRSFSAAIIAFSSVVCRLTDDGWELSGVKDGKYCYRNGDSLCYVHIVK